MTDYIIKWRGRPVWEHTDSTGAELLPCRDKFIPSVYGDMSSAEDAIQADIERHSTYKRAEFDIVPVDGPTPKRPSKTTRNTIWSRDVGETHARVQEVWHTPPSGLRVLQFEAEVWDERWSPDGLVIGRTFRESDDNDPADRNDAIDWANARLLAIAMAWETIARFGNLESFAAKHRPK